MTLTVLWSASCLSLSMAEYLMRWVGDCSDGIGIVLEGEADVLTPVFTFSFSLHSCREARRSAAFSSRVSLCGLHHLGSQSSAGAAK